MQSFVVVSGLHGAYIASGVVNFIGVQCADVTRNRPEM